jgi:hypothetical protein
MGETGVGAAHTSSMPNRQTRERRRDEVPASAGLRWFHALRRAATGNEAMDGDERGSRVERRTRSWHVDPVPLRRMGR